MLLETGAFIGGFLLSVEMHRVYRGEGEVGKDYCAENEYFEA